MDEFNRSRLEQYVYQTLPEILKSASFINTASIILTEDDSNSIWDLLIIFPNDKFATFSAQFGDSYVYDDHNHLPPIFTKFRNLDWLKIDLERRRSIALWILTNSIILTDPNALIGRLIDKHEIMFKRNVPNLVRIKYLELRTERHNLRDAIRFDRKIAVDIIRSTIVKLALELSFLAEVRPYPYKKWLPEIAISSTEYGKTIASSSMQFLNAKNSEDIINLSQVLVDTVNEMLREKKALNADTFDRWWTYLP